MCDENAQHIGAYLDFTMACFLSKPSSATIENGHLRHSTVALHLFHPVPRRRAIRQDCPWMHPPQQASCGVHWHAVHALVVRYQRLVHSSGLPARNLVLLPTSQTCTGLGRIACLTGNNSIAPVGMTFYIRTQFLSPCRRLAVKYKNRLLLVSTTCSVL